MNLKRRIQRAEAATGARVPDVEIEILIKSVAPDGSADEFYRMQDGGRTQITEQEYMRLQSQQLQARKAPTETKIMIGDQEF